jgi:hypothetical protein
LLFVTAAVLIGMTDVDMVCCFDTIKMSLITGRTLFK